jgi:hypothetical protein
MGSRLTVGLFAAAFLLAGSAVAAPLTFDDLSTDTADFVPDGYGGLHWDNMAFANVPWLDSIYGVSGYSHGLVSGSNLAFNNSGNPAGFSADAPFTFNSAYFTGAWSNGLTVLVTGYVGGDATFSKTFTVDSTGPTFETFNWTGLSSVLISTSGGTDAGYNGSGNHLAIDNVSVNGAVPEPASWALMVGGFGLAGMAMRQRRTAVRLA